MNNFKKFLSVVLGASLFLSGCSVNRNVEKKDEGKKLKVVTTIFPEYDLTKAITKDKVDLTLLVKPGVDVHSFSLTPKDIKTIEESDIFIYGGTSHDKWVEDLMKSADLKNKKIVKLSDNIQQLEEEIVDGMTHEHHHEEGEEHKDHHEEGEEHEHHHEEGEEHEDHHEEGEEHEHHHDHEHGNGSDVEIDPHFWTSPLNAIQMTKTITNALVSSDSENSKFYKENAEKNILELENLEKELKEVVANSKLKKVVIADRFPFRYLFDDLKLEYRAFFSGCSVESHASAGQVTKMVDYVKENKIPVVYHIEMGKGDLAKSVAESSGAKVMLLHSIHTVTSEEFEKGVTYIDLMKQNISALKEGLN